MSYNLLAKPINQEIYFLTNGFTFLTKFWMLQVRKLCFWGIFVIISQCCFVSDRQVLMTVSGSFFFSRNYFLEGVSLFSSVGAPHGGALACWLGVIVLNINSATAILLLIHREFSKQILLRMTYLSQK